MEGKGKILIVEDERLVALELRARLVKLGYTVVGSASSADEAIEYSRRGAPDLILMDIKLKGDMDGIEAAVRILRERWLPIIYVTAYEDGETRARARKTKPVCFLSKPYNTGDLLACIANALGAAPSA